MSLLCELVGHKPPVYAEKGWWSPGQEYGKLVYDATDGIGRHHGHVTAECARCNVRFKVARVHIPNEIIQNERKTTK